MNLLKKMKDLLGQAEIEKSHYYTASILKEAIFEIINLRGKMARPTAMIICKRIDCAYIEARPDKHYQCNLTPIEIGQDKKCDSYVAMPDELGPDQCYHCGSVDGDKDCPVCGERCFKDEAVKEKET